jgi:hypothetical protein
MQLVTEIYWLVGISCEGFEGEFLAILIAIEVEECHKQHDLASSSKKGNKGSRKLRNLECSINYDSKGECSSCGC